MKARLHAGNVVSGARLIREIEASLRGNLVYATIRADLENKSRITTEMLRRYFLPRFSRRYALDGKEYVLNLEQKIGSLPITGSLKRELDALVYDYKNEFDGKITQAEAGIENEDIYFKERKRKFGVFTKRLGDRLSPYCRDLGDKIVESETSSTQSESDYWDFRKKCA